MRTQVGHLRESSCGHGQPAACPKEKQWVPSRFTGKGSRRFGVRAAAIAQGGLVSRSVERGEPWRHSEEDSAETRVC